MNRNWKLLLPALCLPLTIGIATAQTTQGEPTTNVVTGTIAAIGYPVGGGETKVNMAPTSAAPQASGNAWVDSKTGATSITLRVSGIPQPGTLGAELLTYVLWTVTPDGTTANLGEIQVNGNGDGKLEVKAQSQTFAMIVTAEPYYAVSMPSQVIVLQNQNTTGQIYPDNTYKLMKRSEYAKMDNPLALSVDLKKVPLDMYEARNAVEIAQSRGAAQYAGQIFAQAKSSLLLAENALSQDSGKNDVISAARQTIQFAEDARALTARREQEERIKKEQEVAAAAAAAQARATAEAQAAEDAKRQAELTAAREAQMKAQAAQAAAQAAAQSAEQKAAAQVAAANAAAAAASAAATQSILEQKEAAAKQQAAQAIAATAALRAELLKQLNAVLQTTDTPRGLVVNMADVLFETGKHTLSMDAELKLAKLSGIIQAHPGLILAIQGFTDTTGTPAINMTLSQQRSDAVRQFLITQGLPPGTITSQGLGQADPIADNSTPAGRKLNRRVDIIVSGKVIGVTISSTSKVGATD